MIKYGDAATIHAQLCFKWFSSLRWIQITDTGQIPSKKHPQWSTADAEMKTQSPVTWWESRAVRGSLFLSMELEYIYVLPAARASI